MSEEKETKIALEETHNEEDTNELSPLNGGDKEKDAAANGAGHPETDASDAKTTSTAAGISASKLLDVRSHIDQARTWINSSEENRKRALYGGGALISILAILFLWLLYCIIRGDPLEDPQFRYLRLVPRQNEPYNTIRYTAGDYGSWKPLKRQMDRFLDDYNNTRLIVEQKTKNLKMSCSEESKSDANTSCYFNAEEMFSLCQKRENYGLPEGSPCVFLTFRNLVGWEPNPITDPNEIQLPSHLSNHWHNGFRGPYVDCVPSTPVDRENMGGPLKFAPISQELPRIFFPFLNQENYMTPFLAIKFDRPARNVYIGLTCRFWAANLTDSEIGTPEQPSAIIPFHLYIE